MIRKILHTFWMVALVLGCLSCVREEIAPATGGVGDGEGLLLLNFGVNESVEVQTKATQPAYTEQRVFNMYVFVFDKDGNKLAGQFFDSGNLAKGDKVDADAVSNAKDNCWWVNNATKDSGDKTNGRVKLRCSAGENLTLYVIANLDSDMVRVSSDLLSSAVHKEADLKKFTALMNQEVVSRNGRFLMTGKVSEVTINKASGTNVTRNVIKTLMLERVDAKVRFKFKKGNNVKSFEARQWKVVNVPRVSYALSYGQRGVVGNRGNDYGNVDPATKREDYSKYAGNFFTTDFVNFEDFSADADATSEFSFYMMENRQVPKNIPTKYNDRSRSLKTSNDLNDKCSVSYTVNGVEHSRDIRMFEYANDFSTYVVVTGYVEMELKNDDAGKVLGGEVEYLIHLGDWREKEGSIDNYNIERNTSYTYTVTVNSLDKIRLEVETSKNGAEFKEEQPGATGQVTIAKEEIALCDCHYVSKTISFRLSNFFKNGNVEAENCIVDELTWSVKTPFGEGEPSNTGDMDFSSYLDYKWVHFRLNRKDEDGNYLQTRRKYTPRVFENKDVSQENKEDDGTSGVAGYHNDGAMTVPQLCLFIKNEVKKYLDNNLTMCAFDNDKDPKITLTVFVDEYYYDENPITHEKRSDLWKWFVNQDDRKLHILCNSEKSKDMESSSTGSVVTIQQSSIQCVYNTDPSYTDLKTAWGVENKDEDEGKLNVVNEDVVVGGITLRNRALSPYWSTHPKPHETNETGGNVENRFNNKDYNGLYNSCKEWGLSPADNTATFIKGVPWSEYMDYEVNNSIPQLLDKYKYMRYACMNRNRDNNGDGIIDREEVRWYLASIKQLVGLYVGDGLLNNKTKLYNKSVVEQGLSNEEDWQQHIVSSTNFNGNSNDPTIIWAEEGISTSHFYHKWMPDIKGSEIRCVRNLGYIDDKSGESYDINIEPADYIKAEKKDGGYVFTCTHLNELALRYYTSSELIFANERSQENNLYKKFEMAPGEYNCGGAYDDRPSDKSFFEWYNAKVTAGIISGKGHPYCPKGYRTPSQIEAAIMRYYVEGWGTSKTMTRTYWSFGSYGNKKVPKKVGFSVDGTNVNVSDIQINTVRCVRDVRTD